jgi:hypothetical protein
LCHFYSKETSLALKAKEQELEAKGRELAQIVSAKEEEMKLLQTQNTLRMEELQKDIETLQASKAKIQEEDKELRIAAEQKLQEKIEQVRQLHTHSIT